MTIWRVVGRGDTEGDQISALISKRVSQDSSKTHCSQSWESQRSSLLISAVFANVVPCPGKKRQAKHDSLSSYTHHLLPTYHSSHSFKYGELYLPYRKGWVRAGSCTLVFASEGNETNCAENGTRGEASSECSVFFFSPWNLTWHKSKARKSQFQTRCTRYCLETAMQCVKCLSCWKALDFSWKGMSGSHLPTVCGIKMKQAEVDNSIKKKSWSCICWHNYKTYVQTWKR